MLIPLYTVYSIKVRAFWRKRHKFVKYLTAAATFVSHRKAGKAASLQAENNHDVPLYKLETGLLGSAKRAGPQAGSMRAAKFII